MHYLLCVRVLIQSVLKGTMLQCVVIVKERFLIHIETEVCLCLPCANNDFIV